MDTSRLRVSADRPGPESKPGHAVVIGGSVAGLLAARVLADHYSRVTVLERDRLPTEPGPRKGIPQARHAHVLLHRGQQILEQLFPGLTHELSAKAHLVDAARDVAWLTPAGWAIRFPSGLKVLSASRDLLEWSIRRRVAALPAVRFREEVDVIGLAANADVTAIVGVALRSRGRGEGGRGGVSQFEADLVVDASGRNSRAPQWLAALGYGQPRDTVVNANLGYASRLYYCPQRLLPSWAILYIQPKPPDGTRGGLILPVEGDRWLVTLSGRSGDYPPRDGAGFLDFALSLPSRLFFESIKNAEPLSPISGFRSTENRLRHFELMSRWPANFVVLGDAACAFNPVYGQGMTTAALGALTLSECLRHRQSFAGDLGWAFQRQLAQVNQGPWFLATNEDLRYFTTSGVRPTLLARLENHYVDRVLRLSTEHRATRLKFLQVLHLLQPPTTLFSPDVVFPLLGGVFRREMREGRGDPAVTYG